MKNFKINNFVVVFLISLLIIGSIFIKKIPIVHASNTKTIVVTFSTTPTTLNVTKAPLKYNKDFALSYTFDDGYIQGYDPVLRYLNGGYVSELGQTVNGLYYSDGTGIRIPFRAAFNWFSNSSNSFGDLHIDTPSNMTWSNLREAYSLGWEPVNHGWTSMGTPTPANTIINYPAENGGPRTIDYNYEVTQNTVRLQAELGATIKHFGLPNGDPLYLPAALSNGMKSISTGQPGLGDNDGLMDAASVLDLSQLQYKRKYFANETTLQNMTDYIDKISNDSVAGENYWGVASSHRVRTPITIPDNGNLSFDNFKNFMDYASNTYGLNGDDSMWMASAPEVYEYLVTKQKTLVSSNLVGNVLTITLDTSAVDNDLRRYALSLIINANADIQSISYDESEFTSHSENLSTRLINLEWGAVFLQNDLTRCEDLVSTAETSKMQADIDTARIYVNLLDGGTQLTEKNAFNTRLNNIDVDLAMAETLVATAEASKIQADINTARTFVNSLEASSGKTALYVRLDNIVVILKSWQVSFGHNSNVTGIWNEYNGSLTTSTILTLKDSSNNISSTTVKVQQNFSAKNSTEGKAAVPANSGYFPDSYLLGMIRMYSASANTNPGIVRLGGLDVNRKYKIILMGSHNLVDAITDKTKTVYSINSVNKELQTSMNTSDVITYENIFPDVNGNIDISVFKKYLNWGYGVLNALKISEESVYTLTYSAGSHGNITGAVSQVISFGSNGTEVTAVPDSNYYFAGWSDGGLTSSRTDLNIQSNKTVIANFELNLSNLSYTSPSVFTKDSIITSLSPVITGTPASYSVFPALPAGLSLNTSTGVISGTPTVTTSLATYTVTATNTGGSTTFGVEITVNDVPISTPQATSPTGTYNSILSITLSAAGSTYIKYATDTMPSSCSLGITYSGAISILSSQTIYVRACDDIGNSSTASFNYIINILEEVPIVRHSGGFPISHLAPTPVSLPTTNIPTSNTKITSSYRISEIQKVTKNFKQGTSNSDIKVLQLFLIAQNKGPNTKKLASHGVTDNFGNLTRLALIEWQKANGLKPDGIFGPKTKAKIKLLNL